MKAPVGLPHIPCETFFATGDFEERSLRRCASTQSIATEKRSPPLFRHNTAMHYISQLLLPSWISLTTCIEF